MATLITSVFSKLLLQANQGVYVAHSNDYLTHRFTNYSLAMHEKMMIERMA